MHKLHESGKFIALMVVILAVGEAANALDVKSPTATLAPNYIYAPNYQNPGTPDELLLEAPDSERQTLTMRIAVMYNLVSFERTDTVDRELTSTASVPVLRDNRTGTPETNINVIPFDFYNESPPSYLSECVVDFNDHDALQLSEPSLWFDRIYLPWFQSCDGAGFVDMRPLVESHFHVGFEDADVLPCFDHPQAYPSHLDDDGTCHFVDVPTEPRTYLTTHRPDEFMWIRLYGNSGSFVNFALNRVRVPGSTAIRFCYRKDQEVDLDWLTSGEQSGTAPGVWLCWSELGPGYWDLSNWVWDVTDVKITAAEGEGGPFSLDDLSFGVQ